MANFLNEISKVPLLDSQPLFFLFSQVAKIRTKKENSGTNVGGGSLGARSLPRETFVSNILRNRQAGLAAESAGTSFNFKDILPSYPKVSFIIK
jgi:hypothetical protein